MRLTTTIAVMGAFLSVSGCNKPSETATVSATNGTVLVVPYTIEPGKSEADAVKAIQAISAAIRTQEGFIDAEVLKEPRPDVTPQYLHVTRWRSLKDWNNVSSSAEFQKVIDQSLPVVRVDLASVYKPVAQ